MLHHHRRGTPSYHQIYNYSPSENDIYPRSSSSDSSDDECKHSNSGACQKPVSNDALTIALAVVIPIVVIVFVLGIFLYRNYRKDKKESMERDPDFDENGEATALPDLPLPTKYNMEDPFHNRNSVRYPQAVANAWAPHNKFAQYNKSSTSLSMSSVHGPGSDPYLDTIVLPYQHQTGSKASLDDYARHFGYEGTRSSAYGDRTRDSSISNSGYAMPAGISNISPQKSSLRTEISKPKNSPSPTKKDYMNIPNTSNPSIKEGKYSVSDIESISNSEDEDDEDSSSAGEKYSGGIKYENESSLEINNNNTQPKSMFEKNDVPSSPFEDTSDEFIATSKSEKAPYDFKENFKDEHIDGDFNFSTDNNTTQDVTANLTTDSENQPLNRPKSPRLSQFNMLKNNSDDEEEYSNALDEGFEGQALSEQQQEELKRMKSVYRVYFDGEAAEGGEFKADPNQALPKINVADLEMNEAQRAKLNRDLTMNTDHEKRMTTTSSIYPEVIENHQGYAEYPTQQAHPATLVPPRELPPLQKLGNASDIRKSTLQTYTDFAPRHKNPSNGPVQPHNPLDGWTSPKGSPLNQSQASFGSGQAFIPASASNTSLASATTGIPSATQLSRASVVMLNPTEITKQRKFKPAGSIPVNGPVSPPHNPHGQFQSFNGSDDSLIPGNRKSDVRKMMNTNF